MTMFVIYVNGELEYKKEFEDSYTCRHWIINHLDLSDDIRYEEAT